MANTSILIKRSVSTGKPVSLGAGELAYSYVSNTIFIGTPDGNGVVNVGGQYYTSQIDNATNSATGDTLVKRDGSGNASFNTIYAALGENTGVSAGTYGSTTEIPVVTVGANGLITSVTTSSISTALNVAADTGANVVTLGTDTLTFVGADGITTTIDPTNNVKIEVDGTVIRTVKAQQSITGDLEVNGNIILNGNTFTQNVTTLNVTDPLIYLAANNYTSDMVDIGFAGNYFDGTTERHTGVIRKSGTNEMYAFTGYDEEFHDNILNIANPSLVLANLHANLIGTLVKTNILEADSLILTGALTVPNGGTGQTTFTSGEILVGNGSGALQSLANSSYTPTGGFSASNTITSLTVDSYGRVTATTGEAISIDASQISSGTLGYNRGGTGSTTYTTGAIVVAGPTGLESLSNTSFVQTGSGAGNNTITSVTVDAFGRFTDATFSAISGLKVDQGGTGQSSFTVDGIIYGNGSGDLQVTAAAGTADQTWSNQILTTTNAGVPVWTTALDGGTF